MLCHSDLLWEFMPGRPKGLTCIVLQGSTIKPLVKLLRVKTQQKSETTMSETIAERVCLSVVFTWLSDQ